MSDNSENIIKASELAKKVLDLSQSTAMVEFRFFQRALSALSLKEYEGNENILFACDGISLYYEPFFVLNSYKTDRNLITRSLIHTLLHCVYRHWMVSEDVEASLWNLACDAAVEYTIDSLGSTCLEAGNRNLRKSFYNLLEQDIKYISAETVYRWLREHSISCEEAEGQRETFKLDQHSLWMSGDAKADENIDRIRVWTEISKKLQTELETMYDDKGALVANLAVVNRNRKSYSEFLRKFSKISEVMKVSDDEYDLGYYSYGLRLYGNVPLIENLEYREKRSIKDFVITVDTSGSVQGDKVQSFIQKTYEMLTSDNVFGDELRVHIIQCDDKVREDAVISSQKDAQKYLEKVEILGLGKTDFRPVFEYVDKLLEDKKLEKLAGLLYFTDGQGTYPVKKRPYPTAFIIHTDEVYPPEVPVWAMRFILEDDII